MSPQVLWFRRDLRLADHPALLAAAGRGPVLGVFVLDPVLLRGPVTPRVAFLHRCLRELDAAMRGNLLVLRGDPAALVPAAAHAVGAVQVHLTADTGPYGTRRDARVATRIPLVPIGSPYAVTPGRVRKPDGSRYQVFTPFFRAWAEHGWRRPAGPADAVTWLTPPAGLDRVSVAELPTDCTVELPVAGEAAALAAWDRFRGAAIEGYDGDRDRPDLPGSSRMSPYLKFGCIHPRTLLADLPANAGAAAFRRELAWREFYADALSARPQAVRRSVDPVIDGLEWDADDRLFAAWQQGRTGYPFVDAGMRQLLAEGWMHNRVRMVVASFLIKDLHLPWQRGATHFLELLVDGDVASNSFGWQYCAGSGPSSAMFPRVFNPVTQGQRYDPAGDYVRRYVPELRGVPGPAVHTPWQLPDGIPDGYPAPVLDHAAERLETLRRWDARRRS